MKLETAVVSGLDGAVASNVDDFWATGTVVKVLGCTTMPG